MTKKILFFSFSFFSLLFPTAIEIKKNNTFENKSNLITKKKKSLKNYGNVTKKAIKDFLNKEKISKNWIFEQYFEVFKNSNIISFNVKNQNIVNVENDEKYVVSLNLKDDGAVYLDKQIYNKMSYIASEISTFSPTGNFLSYNFYNGIFNSSNNEYTFDGTGEKDNKDIVTFKGIVSSNNLIKNYHETVIGNLNGGSNKNKIFKIIDIVLYILGGVIMIAGGLYAAAGAFFSGAGAAGAGLAGAEGIGGGVAGAGLAGAEAGADGIATGAAGAGLAGAEGIGGGVAGAGLAGAEAGAAGAAEGVVEGIGSNVNDNSGFFSFFRNLFNRFGGNKIGESNNNEINNNEAIANNENTIPKRPWTNDLEEQTGNVTNNIDNHSPSINGRINDDSFEEINLNSSDSENNVSNIPNESNVNNNEGFFSFFRNIFNRLRVKINGDNIYRLNDRDRSNFSDLNDTNSEYDAGAINRSYTNLSDTTNFSSEEHSLNELNFSDNESDNFTSQVNDIYNETHRIDQDNFNLIDRLNSLHNEEQISNNSLGDESLLSNNSDYYNKITSLQDTIQNYISKIDEMTSNLNDENISNFSGNYSGSVSNLTAENDALINSLHNRERNNWIDPSSSSDSESLSSNNINYYDKLNSLENRIQTHKLNIEDVISDLNHETISNFSNNYSESVSNLTAENDALINSLHNRERNNWIDPSSSSDSESLSSNNINYYDKLNSLENRIQTHKSNIEDVISDLNHENISNFSGNYSGSLSNFSTDNEEILNNFQLYSESESEKNSLINNFDNLEINNPPEYSNQNNFDDYLHLFYGDKSDIESNISNEIDEINSNGDISEDATNNLENWSFNETSGSNESLNSYSSNNESSDGNLENWSFNETSDSNESLNSYFSNNDGSANNLENWSFNETSDSNESLNSYFSNNDNSLNLNAEENFYESEHGNLSDTESLGSNDNISKLEDNIETNQNFDLNNSYQPENNEILSSNHSSSENLQEIENQTNNQNLIGSSFSVNDILDNNKSLDTSFASRSNSDNSLNLNAEENFYESEHGNLSDTESLGSNDNISKLEENKSNQNFDLNNSYQPENNEILSSNHSSSENLQEIENQTNNQNLIGSSFSVNDILDNNKSLDTSFASRSNSDNSLNLNAEENFYESEHGNLSDTESLGSNDNISKLEENKSNQNFDLNNSYQPENNEILSSNHSSSENLQEIENQTDDHLFNIRQDIIEMFENNLANFNRGNENTLINGENENNYNLLENNENFEENSNIENEFSNNVLENQSNLDNLSNNSGSNDSLSNILDQHEDLIASPYQITHGTISYDTNTNPNLDFISNVSQNVENEFSNNVLENQSNLDNLSNNSGSNDSLSNILDQHEDLIASSYQITHGTISYDTNTDPNLDSISYLFSDTTK